MIRLLKTLFGETSREYPAKKPAKKPAPGVRPQRSHVDGDFRAVSIAPCIACDAVAKDMAGKRYLLREAPRLPMAGCTMPANCSCKFHKHADRRDGDRRQSVMMEVSRWFAGSERRNREGRRSKTN